MRDMCFNLFLKELGRWTLECWRSSTQARVALARSEGAGLKGHGRCLKSPLEETILWSQGSLGPPSPWDGEKEDEDKAATSWSMLGS